MDMIADALLLAGAITAALYCWVLAKRVKGLNDLDTGLGSAIANLSSQVNDMQAALKTTQSVTGSTISEMEELADRAERAAEKLKLMLATVQEDNEAPARRTARVRKFPKAARTEQTPEPEEVKPVEQEEQPAKAEPVKAGTPAQKLQKEVAEKLLNRDQDNTRDELVQALQSILAASK